MPIIIPDQLEAGAVVPQCLDNQYVNAETLAAIIDGSLSYSDEKIRALRAQSVRREFMRSLVYAPQVVINRAYFRNNEFLYNMFRPDNPIDLEAFAQLMEQHAILPFLGIENSLVDNVPFDTTKEGDRACSELVTRVGNNFAGVRFSQDGVENRRLYGNLEKRFGDYFLTLNTLHPESRMEMARELFVDQDILLGDETGRHAREMFNNSLNTLSSYANRHAEEYQKAFTKREKDPSTPEPRRLLRDQIYQEFFIDKARDSGKVAHGRFRSTNGIEREIFFAIKKLVDLRYNSNLPDMLKRYTFTPFGMPSRMALQDEYVAGVPKDNIDSMIDIVGHLRNDLMIDYQTGAYLPVQEDLSLADVVSIRSLPEWATFMRVQSQILADPLGECGNLPELHQRFADLQIRIATWYRDNHRLENALSRYKFAVTLIINIGGTLIPLVFGDTTGWIDNIIGAAVPNLIPENSRGMMAKLAFYAVDTTLGRIDRHRSWTLQIARSNEIYDRGYFLETLRRIQETVHSDVGQPGKLADQGKE